jgi:hypothetical protein
MGLAPSGGLFATDDFVDVHFRFPLVEEANLMNHNCDRNKSGPNCCHHEVESYKLRQSNGGGDIDESEGGHFLFPRLRYLENDGSNETKRTDQGCIIQNGGVDGGHF